MEEKNKIYSLFSDAQTWSGFGSLKKQEDSRILGSERRHRYISSNTYPSESHTTELTIPSSQNVPYTPVKIQTILGSDTYTFSLYPDYELLKDHVCRHVLNPAEMWVQIEPKLDVMQIRNELLSLSCYSHHLRSSQNSSCKWCPYLYDSQCAQLIDLPEITYVSSIVSVLELRNSRHLVVSASTKEIIFIDTLGIIVICACTVFPYEYVVKTAFREESKSIVRKLSREQYYEKAYDKVLTKYAQTGKILSLKI